MSNVYDTLLDVPLEEQDPADDGDDQVVPMNGPFAAPVQRPPLLNPVQAMNLPIAVPFFPLWRGGASGKPVRALNRALSRAGFRKWEPVFSLFYTRWVEAAVKRFQNDRGLPVTGRYDRPTHDKLARYYDQYGIKFLLQASLPKKTKDELERAAFIAELTYLYNRRARLAYTQARPFDCEKPPRGLDCSASGEWAGEYSPIGSLSGFPGCGYGNTDSSISRYRSLGRMRFGMTGLKPGDPVYYGSGGDPGHMGYWLGKNRIWSFGSYPAKILDYRYRSDLIGAANLTGRP